MIKFFTQIKGDKTLWIIIVFFSLFSIIEHYTSSTNLIYFAKNSAGKTPLDVLFKHILILILGIFLILIVHKIQVKHYIKLAQYALFPLGGMLLYLFFKKTGTGVDGARELRFLGLSFRPAPFAIVCLIIYYADYLVNKYNPFYSFRKVLFSVYSLVLFSILILIGRNNLSTAALGFFVITILMLLRKVNIKHYLQYIVVFACIFFLYIAVVKICPSCFPSARVHTWESRLGLRKDINDKKKTEEEIKKEQQKKNIEQREKQETKARAAIISAGYWGKGPGKGNVKNDFAESHSDFVYAVILEEFGILGGIVVVFLFFAFLFRFYVIYNKEKDIYRKFIVIGLGSNIIIIALVNMGVSLGIFPVTGQPLPFLSTGGSFIWSICLQLGIILAISRTDNLFVEQQNIDLFQNQETIEGELSKK